MNVPVDKIFERFARPGVPGCALAVIQGGKIAYKQAYGLADLEHDLPILPSTLFNIGSMAKQFTAFAIALLQDEGKLSFDDDFRQYLHEMPDLGKTIAIRHLIHHTSGLRDTFPALLALAEWRSSDVTTTQDAYWLLKAQRDLNFSPGDEFLYANSNYVLLALICEQVSGCSFAAFCQERIFDPLAMSSSVINDSIFKIIPGRAYGYYEDGQGGWINAPLLDSVVGPTNVYTTVEDLAKWCTNLETGELGGRQVREQMHRPGKLNDGAELDYAFGLELGPAHQRWGWQMIEHGGNQGGYCAHMVRFPELDLSVVVLFNRFLWETREYALKVAELFLDERPVQPAASERPANRPEVATADLSVEGLETKVARYYSAARAALREITIAEGKLQFQGLDLVPMGENLFFFDSEPGTQVEFIPPTDHAPARMKTITPSGDYSYDRVESVFPDPSDLLHYAGRYYSQELDIYWTIVLEGDQLLARRRKYVDSKLSPLFLDAFSDDWSPLMGYPTTYLLLFERDVHDAIVGLSVSGAGVRNLKLVRQSS